ncbi:ABC transporter permease [Spirosoma utsteinense]|uniref:ABC-type antimicrobial peptide transport system permease subunit n=1 Tax=Spirosoma utsteinense TaxID=2585773 RepID=A0ABR6W8W8_9BACT|nr:ABC transporter permease [Spirosoma utsteinense]MBC3786167.1 ABC-type antimicrobial peptide transport system permease subunit [Spirosoma utsteinense]MBC3792357.1 ABC-type antimicrobial peptide transport system permease subunit [Spirosoma utsteinense]
MFRNYLKVAFRTLWKHRSHTFINVVGLSVAFGTCVLLFLTATFELSYDTFHTDADRIFRLNFLASERDGTSSRSGTMPYVISPALKAEFPELEGVSRFFDRTSSVRRKEQTSNQDVRLVDADFLHMFSFPLLKGNPKTALNSLSDIVISEKMAQDVFGKEDPIGKPLELRMIGAWQTFTVTAIVSNAPRNSTLTYNAFIRSENSADYQANKSRWDFGNHDVYVKLKAGTDPQTLQRRTQAFMEKYFAKDIKQQKEQGYPVNELGFQRSLLLIPMREVHYDTETMNGEAISRAYIYTLMLVGLFILAIACINFINLTIAQSITRAREVGVRKSLGAQRSQLFGQIWGETLLLCVAALLIGLGLAYAVLPTFNRLFQSQLTIDSFLTPGTLLVTGLGFLLISLVAGGYPSWFVTRFNAVEVLKGSVKMSRPGLLRNSLIVTQFTIACLLIVCTMIIHQQITYLQQKPMGLDKDQVISVPVGNELNGTTVLKAMRDRLANQPTIAAVSGSAVNIGAGLDGSSSRMMFGFQYGKRDVSCDWLRIDTDYLKTMGVKLIQGRDFSPAFSTDSSSSVLITQSMAKALGETNPVGKYIKPDDKAYQIVGVVSDFNLYSLHEEAKPITLQMQSNHPIMYVLVRVNPQNLVGAMEAVKAAWKTIAPKQEFIGSFLDENTERWYRKEQRLATIFTSAAVIAILLSCMGLFSIALISIQQRTKEIGVRKVLGASVPSIVGLLSKDFLKLVVIGIFIASPIAWWAMNKWLQDFAYKIDVEWWVFVLAGVLAIGIALATVSLQSIRAALMNPVKSLRSE